MVVEMTLGASAAFDHVDVQALASFWAKSDAGGQPHSLIAHLLDAGAVAELIWAHFLADKVRRQLDDAAAGRGRDLFVLLAAWHDLGKATPAFQGQAGAPGDSRSRIRDTGLTWPLPSSRRLAHAEASAHIATRILSSSGIEDWEWMPPLLEGHHGRYGSRPGRASPQLSGDGRWIQMQDMLGRLVLKRLGIEPARVWPVRAPSRGVQLALGGFVVMADWIASSSLFPGLGFADLSAPHARSRAESAWRQLGLTSGWGAERLLIGVEQFESRFGVPARPLQALAAEAAEGDPIPGLMVIEAPMGEGKTEAALAAAEILARRTGCSGVLFAMPTQGTTDAMYTRVASWMADVDPAVPVTLLHGKAILNEAWRRSLEGTSIGGIFDEAADEYGLPRDMDGGDQVVTAPAAASQWITGRHRGLLAEVAVCTVDQVLWSGTRIKFVALRHAGLAGRVLIIDEVHTYDVHMGVFLHEVLRWCARMEVPVILMSATLPPQIRQDLVGAYRQGTGMLQVDAPEAPGYPSVSTVSAGGEWTVRTGTQYRSDIKVHVSVLSGPDPSDVSVVASVISNEVRDGGCALAIFNTVGRAQQVFRLLTESGIDCLLIHGRLTASERARRTQSAIDALGPDALRPSRLVVIATQIAEQSFDVDADVLFSDVAPMDLLLQRVGRLHRHDRDPRDRPKHLQAPRLVITGLDLGGMLPTWPGAFARDASLPAGNPSKGPRTVYRPLALLTAAALVRTEPCWQIPSQVPDLVARAYGPDWPGPETWRSAAESARADEDAERKIRQGMAASYRLDEDPTTLARSLHDLHRGATADSDTGRAVVRDGDDTVEVCLVRKGADGYTTLGGRPLGPNAERATSDEVAREILGDSVRLRWRPEIEAVVPLPQWRGHRLLGFMPVLVLDTDGTHTRGRWAVRYDDEIGLTET